MKSSLKFALDLILPNHHRIPFNPAKIISVDHEGPLKHHKHHHEQIIGISTRKSLESPPGNHWNLHRMKSRGDGSPILRALGFTVAAQAW